jgi:hypothetical protein
MSAFGTRSVPGGVVLLGLLGALPMVAALAAYRTTELALTTLQTPPCALIDDSLPTRYNDVCGLMCRLRRCFRLK